MSDPGFPLGLGLGVLLGIVIDRTVIPLGSRIGDTLAFLRARRSRGR